MRHQRGNILFLILLAVVLFAALSYAVTSSMKGGGNNASDETVKSGSAVIIQQITAIRNAVIRMTMTGGYRLETISFGRDVAAYDGTTIYTDTGHNTACTVPACRVYHPAGGGVSPANFKEWGNQQATGWQSGWSTPGEYDFQLVKWPGAGTDANDVAIRILGLRNAVCDSIAQTLNIPGENTYAGGSSYTEIMPVASWDSGGMIFANQAAAPLYGRDILYYHNATGPGGQCNMYALIAAR